MCYLVILPEFLKLSSTIPNIDKFKSASFLFHLSKFVSLVHFQLIQSLNEYEIPGTQSYSVRPNRLLYHVCANDVSLHRVCCV